MQVKKTIMAVVSDLFFAVKIGDVAKRLGLDVVYAKTDDDAFEKAKDNKLMLVIMDLNFSEANPLDLVTKLKGHADTKSISVISFVSHVQGELKQKAQDAGCDMVMARSAFSQNLPQILKRHAGIF